MATTSSSRKQSYSVLIDAIPPSAIVISFLLFLGAVFASLSVLFFAPPVEEFVYERLTPETRESEGSTFRHLFNGGYNLVADTEHRVNKSNQEVSFALLLRESNLLQGLKKSDVYLELSVTGKKSKDDDFGEPFRVTQRHRRTLDCTSADYFCEPIVVFRQRYIEYPYYRISVKFLNLDEVYQRGFLDDVLFTRFEYTNPEYTVFESTMRTIFLGVSTVVFAFYITSLYWSQELKFWKTEQRWIAVLLLALIGFNNPFFIGEWAGESWFFPFLNIFFQTTFGAVFLLFLLVISHSALVAPANRGFVFYATKILLVIVLWALVLMVGCWERFNEFYDPSVEITEIPFFGSIRVAIVAISIIVLIMISYYTIKAIGGEDLVESTITVLGENSAQTLQFQSQSSRFKVFFMLTFLVVLTLAADYLTFVMFDYANNAAQYLSLFPIINYYAILLAIYFLPSNQIESGGNILIEPGTFKSAKAKKREMIDFDRQSVPESPVNTTDSASEQTSPTNRTY